MQYINGGRTSDTLRHELFKEICVPIETHALYGEDWS